jgi:DNA protecting protein DprA
MPASTAHEITEATRARIVFSHITEPADLDAGALINSVGAVTAYEILIGGGYPELEQLRKRVLPRLNDRIVDDVLAACLRRDIQIVTPESEWWPQHMPALRESSPHLLYVRGNVEALALPRPVAIVGARAATSYGEHVTMELASDLARDHVIVSGAAYGIDGAAHRATLAAGGTTIAYLAGGVERAYPAGHQNLLDRVLAKGAVVSEVPPGSSPTRWRFLTRNRLIAAHSIASIVVEAGWRSGSLNEASHAYDLGRAVGAVPGPITSAASVGCHRLIAEARASLITSADDVRHLTGATTKEASLV